MSATRPLPETPRPQRGVIRCEGLSCRRAIRLLAVPVIDSQGLVWCDLHSRSAGAVLVKRCFWCGRPFGRMRWRRWLSAVFAEKILRQEAAAQNCPLPEEILRRAAEIRATWADVTVWAQHVRALKNEQSKREGTAKASEEKWERMQQEGLENEGETG